MPPPILTPVDHVTKQLELSEASESDVVEVNFVSKFEVPGKISCSKSKAVFDNIDNLPRRRRAAKLTKSQN